MAQLNLLQIVQAVTGELGLVQPSVVIGATDLQTLQLYNLVNRCGDNLKRDHDWTVLQTLFIASLMHGKRTMNSNAPVSWTTMARPGVFLKRRISDHSLTALTVLLSLLLFVIAPL